MRIIMPSFERLEWMPPTINLLKKLDKFGHEVVFISLFPSEFLQKLNLKNVTNISLYPNEISLQKKIKYIHGLSGLLYRIDVLIKKIISLKLKSVIDAELKIGGYLWVVNEMTILLAGKKFLKNKKYSFLIYELHEQQFYARNIEYVAKNAESVVVPEYCRAHIMKSRYQLKKLPFILPNKSDIELDELHLSNNAKNAINEINKIKEDGFKVLVYMGGIGTERPLEGLLDAIRVTGNLKLVILGRDSEYLSYLLKTYDDVIVYLGSYAPPEHLAVARNADIGVLNYVSINQCQGLNALFCAPNKIYEYTGLGLPIIANDIPGLRFDVSYYKCGELVDYNNVNSVKSAIEIIINNYLDYSDAAKKYYDSIDVDAIIKNILASFSEK